MRTHNAAANAASLAMLALALAGCAKSDEPARPAPPPQAPSAQSARSRPPLSTSRSGSDWPAFLGPTGDGKSPETGILTDWPENGPPLVWHCPLGTGYGIGCVADGRFYQFDRQADQARLRCLQAETGQLLWQFTYETHYEDMLGYDNGPRASPIVSDGLVYILGPAGILHCLRADHGTPVWKVDTTKRFGVVQNFFGVGSTPVVEGDLLIVMVGGSTPESRQADRYHMDHVVPNGTAVVAFDKRTGQVRYTLGNELASYSSPKLATIDGRRWGFLFARGGLLAFDPATGTAHFHYPWRARLHDSVNASTPVVVGDEVFISETYGPGSSLLRVAPGGYEVVWCDPPGRNKAMQTHWNTPIYHRGYLYGSSGRYANGAQLRCIEWNTGRVLWSQPGLARASLLYVDGHFVCLSETGQLRLVEATEKRYVEKAVAVIRQHPGGKPLIKPPAWAAPILAHGLLYVRGADQLVCLRLIPRPHK